MQPGGGIQINQSFNAKRSSLPNQPMSNQVMMANQNSTTAFLAGYNILDQIKHQ